MASKLMTNTRQTRVLKNSGKLSARRTRASKATPPLKVLILSTLYSPNGVGGAERVAQTLAEGLLGRGHQVTVATTQPKGPDARSYLHGVDVRYLPVCNIYRPFDGVLHGSFSKALWHVVDSVNSGMASRIGELLEELRPDVLHTHAITGFSSSVWRAAS